MNQPKCNPATHSATSVPGNRALTYLPDLSGVQNPSQARLYELQQGLCVICGTQMNAMGSNPHHWGAPTIEHVYPRSLGCGAYANKALSHRLCNQRKSNAIPDLMTLERVAAIYQALFPQPIRHALRKHPLWAGLQQYGRIPTQPDIDHMEAA